MSIVAHSPPHRCEIAELFINDAATLLLRSAHPCYALYALTTTSLRIRRFGGDFVFRHSQPWRFCHASATLLAFRPTPGLVQVPS